MINTALSLSFKPRDHIRSFFHHDDLGILSMFSQSHLDRFLYLFLKKGNRGTSLSQSHRQSLFFDAKYPLTSKNSSPIRPSIDRNALSKTHRYLMVTASDERPCVFMQ
jgi:hypothetical protein